MDDQVLDLALMTNYSQFTFMWIVASICIDSILSGLVIQQCHQLLGIPDEIPIYRNFMKWLFIYLELNKQDWFIDINYE